MPVNITPPANNDSTVRSFYSSVITNGSSEERFASQNLQEYKNILFPAPKAFADYFRIVEAIDQGTAYTYLSATGSRYTITAGIKTG